LAALFLLGGCVSHCLLMHSEYFDVTGKVFASKPEDAPIKIYLPTENLNRPYAEIGRVKVVAARGTSREAMNEEMIRRARHAGADALIDAQYGEDKSGDFVFCGKVFTTKRNMNAVARAVVFKDQAASEEAHSVDKIVAE
jgi:hypothetical protein